MELTKLKEIQSIERDIKKIIKLLKKIESGEYGICEGCESPIPFNRLMSCSTLDLCRICKEDEEDNNMSNSPYIMMGEEERKFFSWPII